MLTVIIFIIILGVLVFVHELGHFLVAKKNGVKVEEFGFGFPPRIFGIKRGGTIYSINAIPLVGFVRILGEDGQDKDDPHSFAAKKIWRRAIILVAGVTMNIILAIFLLSLGNIIGLPTTIDDSQNVNNARVEITDVAANSPAQAAGLKLGDTIIKMTTAGASVVQNITKVVQVQDFTDQNKGKEITITINRAKALSDLNLTPRANPPSGEGAMGVGLARVADISLPWYRAIYEGFIYTFNLMWLIIQALGMLLWQLISHGKVSSDITGPVGIYQITGQAAKMGFIYLVNLTALLSINLAIINILPFPALDGGRILFLIIEKIKGSPVSQRVERAVHSAGFVFLILLMLLITVRDVIKLF